MNRRTRVARVDLHVNFGMCRTETRQARYEQLACKKRRQQYPQRMPAVAARYLREASIKRLEQGLDLVEQRVSCSGQLERARLTFKQPHTERVLQLFHLVTDGRGREEQLVRGELEAAMTGSNTERPEIPQGWRTG